MDRVELFRWIALTILILAVFVLVFFVEGCNKGGGKTPYNAAEQPHLRTADSGINGTVPPVVGKWTKSPTYKFDFHIYDYPEEGIVVPAQDRAAAEAFLKHHWTSIHYDFLAYKTRPVRTSAQVVNGKADVTIKFYYGKWAEAGETVRHVSDIREFDLDEYMGSMNEEMILVGAKSTSMIGDIPNWRANYSGLAQVDIGNGTIKSVVTWINIYPWFDLKEQFKRLEQEQGVVVDFEKVTQQFVRKIGWHELGHTYWGLNDDTVGTYPGMMVYRYLTDFPSDIEWDVVEWKDGGDNV